MIRQINQQTWKEMETGLQMKEKLETAKLFFILKRYTAGIPIIFLWSMRLLQGIA